MIISKIGLETVIGGVGLLNPRQMMLTLTDFRLA
jgi:hypothetical protein